MRLRLHAASNVTRPIFSQKKKNAYIPGLLK